jgi:signal transduction histidine kinase
LDLKEKEVAVLEKSVQQEAFSRFVEGFNLNITLITVPDYKTAFEIVTAGKADAAITNQFYGAMHAKQYGLEDTAVVFQPSSLFFATKKGFNRQLLNTIDKHLQNLKKDPQSVYYTSLKRWTSEEITFKLPVWLQILGLVAGIVLIMSIGGSFILKRQVNERTKELKQVNEEIEQRIELRTAELAEAMDKAQAADRLKSAFLAAMSHELRTPLNSIIGFTGMVLQGLAGPLNEEQKKQLGMVRGSAHHLLDLINDVLDISKIEAGQLIIMSEIFDLRKSIEKTVQIMSRLADKKNLHLHFKIGNNISEMRGDQRRVEQIILNLLSNAVKFTDRGEINLNCYSENKSIIINVQDTGIGIKPENLNIIFEAFRQVDSGITRVQEGTGLGLNITKKLAEMMGGSIHVQSELGKGSTFTVILPAIAG